MKSLKFYKRGATNNAGTDSEIGPESSQESVPLLASLFMFK